MNVCEIGSLYDNDKLRMFQDNHFEQVSAFYDCKNACLWHPFAFWSFIQAL